MGSVLLKTIELVETETMLSSGPARGDQDQPVVTGSSERRKAISLVVIADVPRRSREPEVDVPRRQRDVLNLETIVPSTFLVDLHLQAQALVLDVPKLEQGPVISSTEIHLQGKPGVSAG